MHGKETIAWKLRSDAGNHVIQTLGGNDYVVTGSGNDIVDLGEGNNFYDGRAGGLDSIRAGEGHDEIRVHRTAGTTIDAGGGNNTIHIIDVDSALIRSGDGDDRIIYQGAESPDVRTNINAGNGNNTITLTENDQIFAQGRMSDNIIADLGNDCVHLDFSSNITIDGGDGDNYIQLGNVFTSALLKTGSGKDLFSIQSRTGAEITIENYGKNDSILLSQIDDVTVLQSGTDVQIFHLREDQTKDLNITVKNAKVADITLNAGAGRLITAALQDPFQASLPVAMPSNVLS